MRSSPALTAQSRKAAKNGGRSPFNAARVEPTKYRNHARRPMSPRAIAELKEIAIVPVGETSGIPKVAPTPVPNAIATGIAMAMAAPIAPMKSSLSAARGVRVST